MAKHGTVAGDGSATVPVTVKPVALPPGSYTLAAVVTNATGAVVTTVSGPAVTVIPATVALSAAVTKVSTTATAPGKLLSFTLTVTNDGTVATTGTASVDIYLSADATVGTVAVAKDRGVPKSPTVRAGGSASYRVTILVPADAAAMELSPQVVLRQDGQVAEAVATSRVTVA